MICRPILHNFNYWLSEHPTVVSFRWSATQSWGSTWPFLITSISVYVACAATLHLLLLLRRRPLPLGPFPALHSLAMSLVSVVIFAGMLSAAAAEIRDTRWIWRRSKTPIQWLLCFPLGTRPSGRVFFWSYAFYLSRFLHLIRTFFTVARRRTRNFPFFHVFNHSILVVTSFVWLEFSQSIQVLAILSATFVFAMVYAFRFAIEIGLARDCSEFVTNCRFLLMICSLICHVGVISMHFVKGDCNGIRAWIFNSVLNGFVLLLFLKFHVKTHRKETANP